MPDNESVHITPHRRKLCVMGCIVSRIAGTSAKSIEKEDGRMRCWMICKLLVTAQPTSSTF